MNNFDVWPHKWFGWWREDRALAHALEPDLLPRFQDWVDPRWDFLDRLQVDTYLTSAPSILTMPSYSDIFGEMGSCVIRTDGVWVWADNLASYMHFHNLRLPNSLIRHIEARDFTPSSKLETTTSFLTNELEWPEPVIRSLTFQWEKRGVKERHLMP